MTLTSYQEKAVAWLLEHDQGVAQLPAGAGKTVTMAAALDRMVQSTPWLNRIGWIAPTIETAMQAHAAMCRFPSLSNTLVQCASPKADMRGVDILVIDECHHSTAATWERLALQCQRRYGLTATPWREDSDRDKRLLALFGGNIFKVSREEVGERLVPAKVRMIQSSDDVKQRIDDEIQRQMERRKRFSRVAEGELYSQVAWQVCADIGIKKNKARNEAVVKAAKSHADDSVLVLVNQIEHGVELAEAIGGRALYSKVGKKVRAEIMAQFRSGECKCVVASSVFDEGADVPRAGVLIMASGGRSKIKTEQRTGRVLRAFEGKEHGIIYDFLDQQHPVMASQSRKRVSLYRSLGYEVEKFEI